MTSEKAARAFRVAVQHRERGEHKAAVDLLSSVKEEAGSASYFTILADSCWELGMDQAAIDAFRRAIEIEPEREAASLGLFHCLWASDDADGAFDEMRRFLSMADSDEYRQLLSDINAAVDDEPDG